MFEKCETETCSLVQSTTKKFACTLDLKCFNWKDLLNHLLCLYPENCEEHLAKLLHSTIGNEIIVKYPIKKSYQLAFLKYLIQEIEDCNIPFTDAYELYVKLLNSPEDEDCYKHYFFENKNIIIKENKNFISEGTTGLCTWEAGKALANWSFCQRELFRGKNILELGCGSGLTGLAIINASLSPKKYIFTDYHPSVLDQLILNLNINIPCENLPRVKDGVVIDVCKFNWEEATDNDFNSLKEAEIIIGADIVYDKNLILSLTAILKKLLDNRAKCAVIACTVRNQETVDNFISAIKSKELTIEQDTSFYPMAIEGNFSSPVNIYLVTK